ncbi:MAG: hypothetical protein RSE05_09305 [Clostridium sp.]
MDKYEFNIKVEQIKKLVNKGDYETAMKIADTIDWRRVRSTSLLTMVAQVYERNEEYQDAKDILLLAFERAPIGKGLLFKLTDLALREGNISEAEAYYREFCELSADDPRQNLLRYLILEARKAPIEQLVNSLECYCQEELDEKWLYKLAELYKESNRDEDCVRICDKIMLMFGLGKYVDKAMELKLQYAPLTTYQMDLVENREKYEEKLRAVEQKYDNKPRHSSEDEDFDESYDDADSDAGAQLEEDPVVKMQEAAAEEDLAKEMSRFEAYDEEESSSIGETRILGDIRDIKQLRADDFTKPTAEATIVTHFEKETDTVVEDWDLEPEEELKNHLMIEAENPEGGLNLALESLKKLHKELGSKNSIAKISGENLNKKGVFSVSDRLAGKDLIIEQAANLNSITVTELSELMEQDNTGMIVVLIDTPERMEHLHNSNPGLADKFQYIGCDQTTEEDFSEEDKLAAAAAEKKQQEEILRLQAEREAKAARKKSTEHEAEEAKRKLAEREAEEAKRKSAEREAEEAKRKSAEHEAEEARRKSAEREAEEAKRKSVEREVDDAKYREEYEEEIKSRSEYETEQDVEPEEDTFDREPKDDHEMDVEEFAQYACKYAAEIDCSISGKSMLALYERAEMMEEDGIPLTKANAEDLLEDAADKAEKHSFGGLFSSKYDKDGLLILKEKHFFD